MTERRITEGQTYQPFGASKQANPFSADVKKETTYSLTKQQLVDMILEKVPKPNGATIQINFSCSGGDDGYGGWSAMDVSSVKVTVTERSKG